MRALPFILALTLLAGCKQAPPPPSKAPAPAAAKRPLAAAEQRPGAAADDPSPTQEPSPPPAPAAAPDGPEAAQVPPDSPLLHPDRATDEAPDEFTVRLETTRGDVLIDVRRGWAPRGADRFYNLVRIGYFDDVAFFRVVDGFMAQAGIHGVPAVNAAWRRARIPDDPVVQSNTRGMVSFATSGPNSRVNQIFINYGDNSRLDRMGFAPFGKVRDMGVVDALHGGYGEGAPAGRGPAQARIQREGNAYLKAEFPRLDYIERASIVD